MGEFILCSDKKVKQPFFHDTLSVHLYTMEELCYYMETNLFLLDKEWIGEALFAWISDELELAELTEQLRSVYGKEKDVYGAVELIFRESGIYSKEEISELSGMLHSMRGKTEMECRKIRADRLLAAGRYRKAAYTYMELLKPEYEIRMTEELHGDIFHNLGVSYARMFLFEEAAEMFSRAWKKRKNPASREAYLYALNFLPQSGETEEDQEMELSLNVMREVLDKFGTVREDIDYYRERKEASAAAEAFDWKTHQENLIERWCLEYEKMS